MAADVLLYNALNAVNGTLITQDATLTANIATQNGLCTQAFTAIATNAPLIVGNAGPNQANLWCLIPTLPATGCPWTSGLKVCNPDGQFRCGCNCAWVVPGGVTCARFQIWGAGAGRGYGCCCAFIPFGGTGAYASVIIPVTAGDTYTTCAGCAYCCYGTPGYSGVDGTPGCASYVTGTNLSNFCAQGGESSLSCELSTRCVDGIVFGGYCKFLGGCICGNNSVCWPGPGQSGAGAPSCCFDNMFPQISSCKTYYGSATGGTVYGIRGSFGMIAINCDGHPLAQHPPVYGFAGLSCCKQALASNYVGGCYRSASNGYMQFPGGGSYANYKCGGGNAGAYGDAGRMGMVCVSYI